jgi:hypothetical protein
MEVIGVIGVIGTIGMIDQRYNGLTCERLLLTLKVLHLVGAMPAGRSRFPTIMKKTCQKWEDVSA